MGDGQPSEITVPYLAYLFLQALRGEEKRRVVVIVKHINVSSVFQQI